MTLVTLTYLTTLKALKARLILILLTLMIEILNEIDFMAQCGNVDIIVFLLFCVASS